MMTFIDRTFLAVSAMVVLAFIAWLGWGRFGYLVRDDPAAKLQAESLAGTGQRTVSLERLTNFEWERVAFFEPYTRRDVVTEALGFEWPEFDDSRINYVDFYSLIVFTKAQRVMRWWKLRRCAPDVDASLNGIAVPRERATFSLINGDGCSVLQRRGKTVPPAGFTGDFSLLHERKLPFRS